MATLNTRIVIRNDSSANWLTNKSTVLLKGEIGIEFFADGKIKMKVGDGTKTWEELSYFGGEESKVFQVSSLSEITETDLVVGDIAIVKTAIVTDVENESNNKYSYTSYVYNGSAWAAMDGNYNADNVYFSDDMMVTKEIGYITLTNGQGTIPSKGKNLSEVFEAMFVKEQNPTTTQPSVNLTFSQAGAYEVGTVVSPTYSATFNAGNYTYGPATGVTVSSWEISDTAGNKTKVSGAITGYRSFFYGVLDTSSAEAPLTSAIVRGLTNGGAYNASKTFTLNGSATAKRIVIAIPSNSTRAGLKEVILTSAMNTPVTDSYVKTTAAVKVEGANGATAIDYTVWTYEPAAIDAGEVHKITLA